MSILNSFFGLSKPKTKKKKSKSSTTTPTTKKKSSSLRGTASGIYCVIKSSKYKNKKVKIISTTKNGRKVFYCKIDDKKYRLDRQPPSTGAISVKLSRMKS